jgi:hypothetical protein
MHMQTKSPDRLSMAVKLMLAILGAILAVIGWYRYIG